MHEHEVVMYFMNQLVIKIKACAVNILKLSNRTRVQNNQSFNLNEIKDFMLNKLTSSR